MDAIDAALIQAWELFGESTNNEAEAKIEALLTALVEAGFVETDEHTWRFTPNGVARAEALTEDNVD